MGCLNISDLLPQGLDLISTRLRICRSRRIPIKFSETEPIVIIVTDKGNRLRFLRISLLYLFVASIILWFVSATMWIEISHGGSHMIDISIGRGQFTFFVNPTQADPGWHATAYHQSQLYLLPANKPHFVLYRIAPLLSCRVYVPMYFLVIITGILLFLINRLRRNRNRPGFVVNPQQAPQAST